MAGIALIQYCIVCYSTVPARTVGLAVTCQNDLKRTALEMQPWLRLDITRIGNLKAIIQ